VAIVGSRVPLWACFHLHVEDWTMLPARIRRRRASLTCGGLLLLAVVVGTATKTAFFMIPFLAAFFGYAPLAHPVHLP
jgi:hypothetical protein